MEDDVSVSLRASSGSYGGGSEVLVVDTLVFDESQITSKYNYSHPTWGGQCHPLTEEAGRAVVIIKTYDDEERTDSIQRRYHDKD